MNIFKKIFGRSDANERSPNNPIDLETITIEDFSKLSRDNRIITFMRFDAMEIIDIKHFEIFKYALLTDADKNVKFACLKRIHLYKEHPDLLPMMIKLKEENNYKHLEPYFSMSLYRLEIISFEDLERIINRPDNSQG